MPAKKQPGFHTEEATLIVRGDKTGIVPSPGATPPVPPADASAGTDGGAGQTLDPDAPLRPVEDTEPPLPTGPAPPRVVIAAKHLTPTVDYPAAPPQDETIAPPQDATPQDATLDPNDPQAKAYQQAVNQATPTGAIAHGASFGDYQLIEPIAKGGMGIVYKARQRKLNRVVALKMILAGQFADQTDVDRFIAEAEAAAALTHPNIVAIHDIGIVNGQHFFSMDYIEGQSLGAMVRDSTFTADSAARYVKTIAETMQFAHDRGIVHRDLKPSNILIDKQLRPLITDFGLAKQVSNQSQLTMSGAIIGTPSYMPPEQAAGDGDRVGAWSDIYSTGAILYELLTGRPPFRAASPFETVRQVIEMEPVSPRLVNPSVPKDLETICLKCLQKEPTKRYATSQELAEELNRFLLGEPIKARPIGRIARVWRMCKRYPYTATAIATSILFLIVAAASASVAYVKTSQALAKSEESLREAIDVVNKYLTVVSEDTLLKQDGLQPLRKDLLELALDYYQRFLEQRGNDPLVQDELAAAYYRIGLITELLESPDKAIPSYEMAEAMQQSLLAAAPSNIHRLEDYGNTLNALGIAMVRTKSYTLARERLLSAAQVREKLAEAQPQESEFQRLLANTYMNIGISHQNQGDLKKARMEFDRAQVIRQAAIKSDPRNPKLRRDLAKAAFNMGTLDYGAENFATAEQNFRQAVSTFQSLVDDDPANHDNQKALTLSLRVLGDLKSQTDPAAARGWYQQAIDRLVTLARNNPNVPDFQFEQAGLYMNLGILETEQSNNVAALAAFQTARSILAPLVRDFPNTPRYQRDYGVMLRELAQRQAIAGDKTQANQQLAESQRILKALCEQYPNDGEFLFQWNETMDALEELQATKETPPK